MPYSFGRVSYVNVEPLFALGASPDFDFFPAVPSVLNEAAINGKFDVSILSMWSYPKFADKYKLVPCYGVFGDGKIMSVKLFSRFPIESLGGRKIYLTSESGSSVRAFEKLCSEVYRFVPNVSKSAEDADAVFLIGNRALRFSAERGGFSFEYDFGQLWKSAYGVPMAYAGVIAKREIYDEVLPKISSYFDSSLKRFFSSRKESVKKAAVEFFKSEGEKISESELDEYYGRLSFKLPEREYGECVEIALNGKDFK